jgi:predicted dehydrogenase
MIRFGILSTSSIAPRFVAGVRAVEAGEIVALSSRSQEKAEEKARLWDIPKAYGSHEALLADPEVDVVYISTVNALHYTWAKAALEAGKHVICEKPCTTEPEQTRELFRLARENDLFFMEAEKMLFLPTLLEVRRRIEAGELGQIHMIQLSHSFPGSYNGWMFDKEAGGGPLLSSGIYAVQLLLWLFGPIREISGKASRLDSGVEWQYILTGETESGILFSIHNSTRGVLDNAARICGSQGWVEIPEYWKARKATFHISGREPETVEYPCQHELSYEAAHIRQCLDQGLLTSPVVTEAVTYGGIEALKRAL